MKKQISLLFITGLIFSLLINASTALAAESVQSGFNPNKLIDDKVFSNEDTMSASDIQKFLESKNSVLANTSNSFVSLLREPINNKTLKETLEDPKASSTSSRSAAELIYDAAQSSGINPQVILVTLNKEQSLITGRQTATPEQLQRALDFAMGFGCPDSQPCGEIYKGFYFQLFGGVDVENNRYLGAARSLMKSYETPGGRGPFFDGKTSKVGDAITLGNTTGNYEGVLPQQSIVLSNAATAALYRYTPHVFNGNYNFWKFFKSWFGGGSSDSDAPVNGDLFKTSSGGDVWIIENNLRYKVLPWVAKLRKINLRKAEKVSSKLLNSFVSRGVYPVPDNTIVEVDDKFYVFIANQRRLITEAGIKSMGLDVDDAIELNTKDLGDYQIGPDFVPVVTAPIPVPPPTTPPSAGAQDGAILKGANSPAVYLVSGGKLKLFTYATFLQYEALKNMQIVPEDTISKYEKDGLVLPKAGSLIKSFGSATVYFYEDGKKKPMDAEIFRNRGFSFTNVYELDQKEIDALELGPFPLPVNDTYFTDKKSGAFYLYREGKKSKISAFVAKQKQMTPDFTFGEDTVNNIPDGVPVMPREGTVFKSDKAPDVYIMNAGLAFPMTGDAFKARGITVAQVNILPQAEVDSYPKGSVLTK
jgi:hypothetical protein